MSDGRSVHQATSLSGPAGNLRHPRLSRVVDAPCRYHIAWLASFAVSLGALGLTAVPAKAGCNSGNVANTDPLTGALCQASASGFGATAVGSEAAATGTFASAFGLFARATRKHAVAIGAGAQAFGEDAVIVGRESGPPTAVPGVTSIGAASGRSGGHYSTSVGALTEATGGYSIAIGGGDSNSVAAQAAGAASIAIGNKSVASGSGFASAFGFNARADVGLGPVAVGTDSLARKTKPSVEHGVCPPRFSVRRVRRRRRRR
jgi:hypothetical protein